MKNKLLLFSIFLMGISYLSSQTILIEENFDGLSAGDKLVQSINNQSVWDTWSSAPGGGEDATISSDFAFSPENSLFLANNNDVVMLLNDLTTGRYKMNFKALIATGRIGYFNMLHNFSGGNSDWAFQVYFNPTGIGTVDAGKPEAALFLYPYDTWMDISVIIDLDDDFATLYIDDSEIVSWKFSLGTSGGGTTKKLDAVNFYGITQGGSSGMYIDDVIFSKVDPPVAPTNLKAEVVNDTFVNLSWDIPSIIPDNYVITRNDEVINTDVIEPYFSEAPYPGDSRYSVRSHTTGFGYSTGSNEVSAFIPGGMDREFVLFEIGTGTGCVFCPGASMGAVDMVENGDDVIILKYHNYNANDPFNTPASAERASNYYYIEGYPTSFADGTLSLVGGSTNQSLFEYYHQHYTQRMDRKILYTLDLNVFHLEGNHYRAEIGVEEQYRYITEAKTLHTALTESDIDFQWQNQSQIHWACRNMFPDAFGTPLDFSEEPDQYFNIDFYLEDGFVKDNCEFVVFVQADPSKEVMVAAKVDMEDVLTKTENRETEAVNVYPNPASNYLYFTKRINRFYQLMDVTGKTVLYGKTKNKIDVSNLETGLYYLQIEGLEIKKIVIN